MPIVNGLLINSNNDDEYYEALFNRQTKNDKKTDTFRDYDSSLNGVYCSSSA